jgi:transcription elongation factor GreA
LENRQRPQAVKDVSTAVQKGDLSENAEYHEARARLSRTDTRIFNLKEKLKTAVIIEKGSDDGRVKIGSTVVLEVNGKQRTYEILGSLETDPSRNRISHESPLGSALLDHKVGDTVTVKTPSGEVTYAIIEVQ